MRIFAYNDFILKKNKGGIYADDSHILFIKATCETYFDEFQLGSRCIESPETGHYFFTEDDSEVLVFPFYLSVSQFFKNPSLFRSARDLLKSAVANFDVFWLTWPHPISFLVLTLVGRKRPVVLFVRQNLEALIHVRYSGVNRFVGKRFTKFLYAYARLFHKNALIVSVGDEMYNYFKPVFRNNFYISDSIVSEKLQLPARKEFSKDAKLLFVGRLEPEKGLVDLIHALNLINESVPVSLTIVGEGGMAEELKLLVDKLKLSHCVKFEGYQAFGENLFKLYRSHDIMVISSYSEGLPKIINEARAFAMPIVSTKVGGIAKELKEGETCLFVPPGKPELLAAAVVFLLHNPKIYQRISQNLHNQFSSNSLEYWSGRFAELVKDYASENF